MSRKSFLKRVSIWLEKLAQARTKPETNKQKGRSFGFHQLEDRIVLDASFSIDIQNEAMEFNASDFGDATNLSIEYVSHDINGDGNLQESVKFQIENGSSWNLEGDMASRYDGSELKSDGNSLWVSKGLLSIEEADDKAINSSVLSIVGTRDLDIQIVSLPSFGSREGFLNIENVGDISQPEDGGGIEVDFLQLDNVGNVNLMNVNNDILCLCGNIDGNLSILDNNGLTINDVLNVYAESGSNLIQSNSPLTINADINVSTDLTLTAGNDAGAVGDDLTVRNNAVVTINSAINRIMTIQAGDNVILGDAAGGGTTGTLRTIGGGTHQINVVAARDGSADGVNGSVVQAFGTQNAISTDTLSITAGDGIGTSNVGGGGSNELKLQLFGQTGSNVITYIASGSVTVGNGTLNTNSSLALAPNTGVWTSSFDNNLGDMLSNSMNTTLNDDLPLSNGGVSYRRNGTQFGVLDLIDLDGSTGAGGDDIELDTAAILSYPTLSVGDVLSWSGSGTFTLEDSETFDTLFVATGTFQNAIDGGNYVVEIIDSAGLGGTLKTSVSTLTAAIDGPNGIEIENEKSGAELVINGITDAAGGGDVSVTNNSPMTVAGDITVGGNLTLVAGDSANTGDDLKIAGNATITIDSATDGKVMTLTAGDDVIFGDLGGGTVGTARTINGNHSIIVTANNDGTGDGDTGSVSQENGANQALITDDLTINSGGSVDGLNSLIINVNDASISGPTGIDINNASAALNLTQATATSDNIEVTTAGTLTAGNIVTSGNVTLNAVGAISDDGNAGTNVSGNRLTVDSGGAIDLDTAISELDASTSGAGDITISDNGSVTLVDVDTFDGLVDIVAAGNLVATDVATGDDGSDETHNITLRTTAPNAITVGTLNSDNDIVLNSFGSILNDGNAATRATGNRLTADAGGQITIDTAVAEIDASTSVAGNITIVEMDGVDLIDIDTFDGGIDIDAAGNLVATDVVSGDDGNDASQNVDLSTTAGGTITVGTITSDFDIILIAAGAIQDDGNLGTVASGNRLTADAGGAIDINSTVVEIDASTSAAGGISIVETDGVTLVDIDTFDGAVDIDAGGNLVATDVATGDDGADATHGIDLSTTAGGTITVGAIMSDGDVILNASGAIVDDGNAGTLASGNRLTADAGGGIDLDTTVAEIDASTSAAGNITIVETDGVDLVDIDTFDGLVDIDAAGNLVATDVATGDDGNDATHNIDLMTTAGGTITVGILMSDGDIVLNASGAILDDGNGATSAGGDRLTADAGGGIDLDTAVAEIDASTSAAGNITINESDGVELVDVDTFDGLIDIDAAGNLVATDVATGDDGDDADHNIDLATTGGGTITVGSLTSDGDVILNGGGAIVDDGNGGTNISGNKLTADAQGGIDVDTAVDEIDASTSAAGNIDITEVDALSALDADTFDGLVRIIAGGNIVADNVVSGDDGSDETHNVVLQATTGDVTLVTVDTDHDLRVTAQNDILDQAGSNVTTGRNFITDAGRTLKIGDDATDTINVTGFFSVRSRANAEDSAIEVGVSDDILDPRGTDSGATVTADRLRFRSSNSAFSNVGDVTISLDSGVKIVSTNNVTSFVLNAAGNIVDNPTAQISIKEDAVFVASDGVNDFDITLGDDFGTNLLKFRNVSLVGEDISIERNGRILLDGVKASGNLTLGTTADIRQTGVDRFDSAGTSFVEVAGDTEFIFDNLSPVGGDIKLVSNSSQLLMDNLFEGMVTVTTTGFTGNGNGTGSIRDIDIRDSSTNAMDLNYQIDAADTVDDLFIWTPNSSFEFTQSVNVDGAAKAFVGVDSETIDGPTGFRVRGGKLVITDAGSLRDLTDAAGFGMTANDATFIVANNILLADNATDSLEVTNRSIFTIFQDAADSMIQVGVDPNLARGTDSGALYTTDEIRFRAPVGDNGVVTILIDSEFTILPESNAGDALVEQS